jgi:hypothetical protein
VLKSVRESVAETKDLYIPSYRLRSRDQLQFGFRFALKDETSCRDARSETVKAVVGADSTLDFSGFPHYARLPNLNHFATVGFPFTRFADLAQTVVVIPEKPSRGRHRGDARAHGAHGRCDRSSGHSRARRDRRRTRPSSPARTCS